jgi:hypothetical protein
MSRSLEELRGWMRDGMPVEALPPELYVQITGGHLSEEAIQRIEACLREPRRTDKMLILPADESSDFELSIVDTSASPRRLLRDP